ncbi:aldehyde dehydrogenase [Atractiella rhizophila]|nr:aldehyde dehydrogenase [Atractiella rhizophila]
MKPTIALKPSYASWISNKFVTPSAASSSFQVLNPATSKPLASVYSPSNVEIGQALSLSQATFDSGIWSRASPSHRSQVLQRAARIFEERLPRLVELETLQTGRPIREMKTQLGRVGEWFEYFASVARTHEDPVFPTSGSLLNYMKRYPLGVVAQITPWNHPLLISIKKLSAALAAGCSVVVKPSELAPLSVLELGDVLASAGVPEGVVSILPGGPEVVQEIIRHPSIRRVDFTGGTPTGVKINQIIANTGRVIPMTAELGGKAPILIFEDADLETSINGLLFASFVASGQTCVSGTRLLIHESLLSQFKSALVPRLQHISKHMRSPLDPETLMGPLISASGLTRVEGMVKRALQDGAELLYGGQRPTSLKDDEEHVNGFWYEPTVLVVDREKCSDYEVWKEEAFGPVLVVTTFSNEEEAIRLANDSQYGLGAGIWTSDGGRAIRVSNALSSGMVWINTHHRNDPSSPWGGVKGSGIGKENGKEAYESYTVGKSVIWNYARTDEAKKTDDWFGGGEGVRYG